MASKINPFTGDLQQISDGSSDTDLTIDGTTLLIDNGVLKANLLSDDAINIQIDEIRARDIDGLQLNDDAGNGIFVKDGGNVGIGIDPTEKLHVNGITRIENLLINGGNVDTRRINLTDNNSRFSFVGGTDNSEDARMTFYGRNWTADVNKQGNIGFVAGNNSNAKIDFGIDKGGSISFGIKIANNGDVGIGDNATLGKLHVKQVGDNSNNGITTEGTGGGTGRFYHTNSNTVVIQKGTNDNQLVLNDNGNVGIGIANPVSTLDVNGLLTLRGAIQTDDGDFLMDFIADRTISTNPSFRFRDISGNVSVDILDNGRVIIPENLTVATNLIFTDKGNGTVTIGNSVTGTDRFNVFGGGFANLQTGIASFYNSAGTLKLRIRDEWTANSIPPRIESESALGFAFNTTTNSKYVWYVNGTNNEKMRLDSTGLGIGTTSPDAQLDVEKSVAGSAVIARIHHSEGTNGSSHAILHLQTETAFGGDPHIRFTVGGQGDWVMGTDNGDTDAFKISNSTVLGTTTRFKIDFQGNVTLSNQLKIVGGNPGAGKIFTSDANGLGTWESPVVINNATNNYMEIGNMIIQWGQAIATSGADKTISLHTAFADTAYMVQMTPEVASSVTRARVCWLVSGSQTTTNFKMRMKDTDGNNENDLFNWTVVGVKP